jgi:hypothetical protein
MLKIRRRPTKPKSEDKMIVRFLWLIPESDLSEGDIATEEGTELEIEVLLVYPSMMAPGGIVEVDIAAVWDCSEELELE